MILVPLYKQRFTGQKRFTEMWCAAFLVWSGSSAPGTHQKATGYNHNSNHSTRSPFLHTTKIQTKPPSKEELNDKTITPKSTNLTPASSQPTTITHHRLSHWNAKPPSRLQNLQTNHKFISSAFHVTATYPTNTPTAISTKIHAFIHIPCHISKKNCGATGHHPLPKTLHIITHSLYSQTW